MIVDCHTHWADCYQSRDGLNPSRWLEIEKAHGVTHAIVLPFSSLFDDTVLQKENDDLADVCAASNGRMIPFCVVNPFIVEKAVAEFERCITRRNMKGLKLHPWIQGVSPNLPAVDRLCEMAAHWNVPVLFHDGTPCFSLPSQIALLARRHPKTQIILGHAGLFEHWREAIAAMYYADNLWACLCGPYLAGLREIVRRCPRERLLWGSDFGFTLQDVVGYRWELLSLLELRNDELEMIVSTNPQRLLAPILKLSG